jgi:ubiquinone/menaquinone biosynthesis C-methylase UbiE
VGVNRVRRRWELTPAEWARIEERRGRSLDAPEAIRTLARAPHVWAEAARMVLDAAIAGVRSNSGLIWLIAGEQVRQEVPDAARGVSFASEDHFVTALLPRLGPGQRVLELGCGDGRISRHVAPRVRELVCTDVSRIMLKEARENLSAFPNVRFGRTRGVTLPRFEDQSFDLVYAQGLFTTLETNLALGLLDEVRRVLRTGGLAVLNFFTPLDRPDWANEQLEYIRRSVGGGRSGTAKRTYAACQVEKMYAVVGLRVVDRGFFGRTDAMVPYVVIGEAGPRSAGSRPVQAARAASAAE